MVWNAYIDDSKDDDLFVLAGYIAREEEWAKFSKEWKLMLSFLPRFETAFKMGTLMHSEEGREKALAYYRVIEKYDFWGLSCSYKKSDLINAVDSISWPEMKNLAKFKRDLKNPYYFGFKAIINVLCQYQVKMGITESVDFVFDEQTEKNRVLDAWELFKNSTPPTERKLMGAVPQFCDDEKVMPLQAADLFAWLVRDSEAKEINWMDNDSPFPWKFDTAPIKGLHMKFSEQDFSHELMKGLKIH